MPARFEGGRKVLERFAKAPLASRFFLRLRWLWTPYAEMASFFPAKGKILDGGSGHGLLALTLALQSPRRQVRGIDHSPFRLALATEAARGLPNLTFEKRDFRALPGKGYSGIAFVDVLHYLPYSSQSRLLRDAYRCLEPGGLLLFREVDPSPGLLSAWNRLHEAAMTGLGFTKAKGLHFRTVMDWKKLAEEAGFRVRSKPAGRFPFADILFRCRKP